MESLTVEARLMDDLLNFSSDFDEDDDNDYQIPEISNRPSSSTLLPFPEFEEEELEWISNKDAFPMIESLVDIMPNHPSIATSNTMSNNNSSASIAISNNNNNNISSHQSPISVLENNSSSNCFSSYNGSSVGGGSSGMLVNMCTSFKVPGKARSKRGRKRRRSDMLEQMFKFEKKVMKKLSLSSSSTLGRKCLHCGSEKTPQWRAGPLGPKTLCNACGVRYKSGRLCDEYRPANSPTFSSELHSNSHRKIIEMRKQEMLTGSKLRPPNIG